MKVHNLLLKDIMKIYGILFIVLFGNTVLGIYDDLNLNDSNSSSKDNTPPTSPRNTNNKEENEKGDTKNNTNSNVKVKFFSTLKNCSTSNVNVSLNKEVNSEINGRKNCLLEEEINNKEEKNDVVEDNEKIDVPNENNINELKKEELEKIKNKMFVFAQEINDSKDLNEAKKEQLKDFHRKSSDDLDPFYLLQIFLRNIMKIGSFKEVINTLQLDKIMDNVLSRDSQKNNEEFSELQIKNQQLEEQLKTLHKEYEQENETTKNEMITLKNTLQEKQNENKKLVHKLTDLNDIEKQNAGLQSTVQELNTEVLKLRKEKEEENRKHIEIRNKNIRYGTESRRIMNDRIEKINTNQKVSKKWFSSEDPEKSCVTQINKIKNMYLLSDSVVPNDGTRGEYQTMLDAMNVENDALHNTLKKTKNKYNNKSYYNAIFGHFNKVLELE